MFNSITRRTLLHRMGTGMGALGLAAICDEQKLFAAGNPLSAKPAPFAPRAKHVIHLMMNGGPSQVDTFDPKPSLA